MMYLLQTKDQRILQLEEEIEELIEYKDKMNPEIYAAEYKSILEHLFYVKNYRDYINEQVLVQE